MRITLLAVVICKALTLSNNTVQIEEALRIFQDMVQRGCERNVITYSSLISACEKAGRWQLALELLEEMHRDNCKPNVVTFNSLIGACGQGALHKNIFTQSRSFFLCLGKESCTKLDCGRTESLCMTGLSVLRAMSVHLEARACKQAVL